MFASNKPIRFIPDGTRSRIECLNANSYSYSAMLDRQDHFNQIHFVSSRDTAHLADASRVALVVSTHNGVAGFNLTAPAQTLIAESLRLLRPGGLLFIYGTPLELPHWGEHILASPELSPYAIFKYWIALDINEESRNTHLQLNQRGLLLFMKNDPTRKQPPKFVLHTKETRVPHRNCTACGQNVKDWGGKKHLRNPAGAALSDVWRDQPRRKKLLPTRYLNRFCSLKSKRFPFRAHFLNFAYKMKAGAESIAS